MGLDMYAFRVSGQPALPAVDAELPQGSTSELSYWRKHPNLHGWMEQLYRAKGGKAATFNCVAVEVTTEDLDKLEAAVSGKALPETSGFFFGQSHPEDATTDRRFIADARSAIGEGDRVYYDSWW